MPYKDQEEAKKRMRYYARRYRDRKMGLEPRALPLGKRILTKLKRKIGTSPTKSGAEVPGLEEDVCSAEPDFLLDPPVRLSSSSAGAFYLDSDSMSASTDLVDIRVGSGAEAVTVQVNRLMLAASCSLLRDCLKSIHNVSTVDGGSGSAPVILMPWHHMDEVRTLLQVLHMGWKERGQMDLSPMAGLAMDVGFLTVQAKEKKEEDDDLLIGTHDFSDSEGGGNLDFPMSDGHVEEEEEGSLSLKVTPESDSEKDHDQQLREEPARAQEDIVSSCKKRVPVVRLVKLEKFCGSQVLETGTAIIVDQFQDLPSTSGDDSDVGSAQPPTKKRKRLKRSVHRCIKCKDGPLFREIEELVDHAKENHLVLERSSNKEGWLACPEEGCDEECQDFQLLETHLNRTHSVKTCLMCCDRVPLHEQHNAAKHRKDCRPCYVCSFPCIPVTGVVEHSKEQHGPDAVAPLEASKDKSGEWECPHPGCRWSAADRLTVCSHVAREHDWWPCYYCLEPLPAKNTLAHLLHFKRIHPGKTQRHCAECNSVFLSKADLASHRAERRCGRHVPKVKEKKLKRKKIKEEVMCDKCGDSTLNLRKHMKACSKKAKKEKVYDRKQHPRWEETRILDAETGQYRCPECHASFDNRQKATGHLNRKHNPQECPWCHQMFGFYEIFHHVVAEHAQKVRVKPDRKDRTPTTCEVCGMMVDTDVKKHLLKCRGSYWKKLAECSISSRDIMPNEDGTFICPEKGCDFLDKSAEIVRIHYLRKHKRQDCPYCGKNYTFFNIRRHIAMEHTGETKLNCKECGKGFWSRTELRKHAQSEHSDGQLNFECDICGKRFPTRVQQTTHRAEHTRKKRQYPCPVCGKNFRSSTLVQPHMITAHPVVTQEPAATSVSSSTAIVSGSAEVMVAKKTVPEVESDKSPTANLRTLNSVIM